MTERQPPTNQQLLERFARLTFDEPAVRKDGHCHVCLKPRRPERSQTYAKGCAQIDAFCSSDCARIYHRNPLPERPTHPGRPPRVALCGSSAAYKQGCRCDTCRAAQTAYGRAKRAREAAQREHLEEGATA